ncbi:hypothetical protein MCP1_70089 [Candidatus Terasakiella magnetica]|nr:hypothetical protein MCP1_70089 [Candidatus Terasakiella magnetica]
MNRHFQSVRALLCTPDSQLRQMVAGTLINMGCRQMITADHTNEADHYLQSDMIDLLVMDAEFGLLESCQAVQRVRNRVKGDNTFALSVILTPRPDPQQIALLMDSGADAILAKPFQPVALADRIGAPSSSPAIMWGRSGAAPASGPAPRTPPRSRCPTPCARR